MKKASKTLLARAEGQEFDRKAAEFDRRSLANILVSFANADGGTVALGIKNKQFEGIDHLDTHKINDFKTSDGQTYYIKFVFTENNQKVVFISFHLDY